jgi:hypothetical protein
MSKFQVTLKDENSNVAMLGCTKSFKGCFFHYRWRRTHPCVSIFDRTIMDFRLNESYRVQRKNLF